MTNHNKNPLPVLLGLLTLAFLLMMLAGCQKVPATKIQITTGTGKAWLLESPKDTEWTNVVAHSRPDGSFDFSIGGVKTHNDKDIVLGVVGANVQMADKLEKLTEKFIDKAAQGGLAP